MTQASKALYAILAAAIFAASLAAPANAAIICDEDECKPAIILPGPLRPILIDDDCDCDD